MMRMRVKIGAEPRGGGAVIIVVLALMTTLMFLGMFFFFFTDEARLVSENVAEAEDWEDGFSIDPEKILDHGLQQVVAYTPSQYGNSALYGGQWSMLAHQIGTLNGNGSPRDLTLFNGLGVNVITGSGVADTNPADGHPDVKSISEFSIDRNGDGVNDAEQDSNGNGIPDPNEDVNANGAFDTLANLGLGYAINYSATANPFGTGPLANFTIFQGITPDAGYTYPDLNSLFLAYEDRTSGVVIPSFFRPQLFPDERAAAGGFADLYRAPGPNGDYRARVLRPHAMHGYGPIGVPFGTYSSNRRYLTTATTAQSGDRNRLLQPFPFQVDVNGNGLFNEAGPLTAGSNTHEFDVDADLDGRRDSIYVDLDHPLITLPDGRQFVPMYYFKVQDADALLNVNAHGNLNKLDPSGPLANLIPSFGPNPVAGLVHKSNLGMDVSEINPQWGLTGNPKEQSAAALQYLMLQHATMFGFNPVTYYSAVLYQDALLATANMELAMMLLGRVDAYGSPQALWPPGRFGQDGLTNPNAFAFRGSGTSNPAAAFANDDDRDFAGWDFDPLADVNGDGLPDWQDLNMNGIRDLDPADPGYDVNMNGIPDWYEDPFNGALGLGGRPHLDRYLGHPQAGTPLVQPPFVHPLDYRGRANYPQANPPGPGVDPRTRSLLQAVAGSPAKWPDYDMNWQTQGTNVVHGVNPLLNVTALQPGADVAGLINEPNETLLGRDRRSAAGTLLGSPTQRTDELYGPQEMAALHLSEADWRRTGNDSRLRSLLSYNFEHSTQAAEIRRRFTTDSWDRKEFSYTPNSNRSWELNDIATEQDPVTGLTGRFPPAFNGITSRHEAGVNTDVDPFRPVLRRLLTVFSPLLTNNGNLGTGRPQHKLNINKLLVNFDQFGNPLYRELMPHPVFDPQNDPNDPQDATAAQAADANAFLLNGGNVRPMYHENSAFPGGTFYNPSSGNLDALDPPIPAVGAFGPVSLFDVTDSTLSQTQRKLAQEVWARYDRQRLARDIYVMLYTLSSSGTTGGAADQTFPGAGDPFVDPTTGPIDPDVAKEMAQFAVNFVDALDRDSVITRFEYDPDLSDGWDITGANLQVVYGVEKEELSFSEVLFVQTTQQANDLNVTLHRDDDSAHQFLYMELRNASPFPVNLDNETWRVVRTAPNSTQPLAAVQFRSNVNSGMIKTVQPGGNFLLTCHDGSVMAGGNIAPSDFWCDWNNSGPAGTNNLEPAIPVDTSATSFAEPLGQASGNNDPYLDLAWPGTNSPHDHSNFITWVISDNSLNTSPPGGRYQAGNNPQPSNTLVEPDATALPFDLVLQRRQNLRGVGVGETEWIEVDRFNVVPGGTFSPTADTQMAVLNELNDPNKVRSMERSEPLDRQWHPNNSGNAPRHSLDMTPGNRDAANSVLGVGSFFTLWQPHFDRDFASIVDLLALPLYGPTAANANGGNYTNLDGSTTWRFSSNRDARGELMAKRRFQHPEGTPTDPVSGSPLEEYNVAAGVWGDYPNRWYRLLGLLEAKPGDRSADEMTARLQRLVGGKLNLNTVRDETVLAGLIDDEVHLNPFAGAGTPATQDRIESGRNWYNELRLSRDGIDPVTFNPPVAFAVPGLPGARPFRELSYLDPVQANEDRSVASTVLRDLAPLVPGFGLFDARPVDDVRFFNFSVDFHTARRILAKVHNLSTVRSHVYVVHCGYDLFEAHQLPNGNVQIGSRSETMRGGRQFLVIDMSRLEEAYDPLTQTFDFRKFIIYRQTLP